MRANLRPRLPRCSESVRQRSADWRVSAVCSREQTEQTGYHGDAPASLQSARGPPNRPAVRSVHRLTIVGDSSFLALEQWPWNLTLRPSVALGIRISASPDRSGFKTLLI